MTNTIIIANPFGSLFPKVLLQLVILKYDALHGPSIPSIPNVSRWLACKDVILQLRKACRSNCITASTVVTDVKTTVTATTRITTRLQRFSKYAPTLSQKSAARVSPKSQWSQS